MAGSIKSMNAVYQKQFKYVPPTPPSELIDCTNFILDFTGRKFLNVGLDPTDEFNIVVQIITLSRYINMLADFLRRIFSLMGNILSFILNQPQKYKRNLFLETEIISLSSMVYQGENMLVIEAKKKEGCRVLLDKKNLLKLQYLEESIFETIVRKTNVIRPVVLNQFAMIGNYIDREFTKVDSLPKTIEEMIIFIKNLQVDQIISSIDLNFVSQLKMNASPQLAEQWAQRWSGENSSEGTNEENGIRKYFSTFTNPTQAPSGENSPEFFTESEMRLISPLSPPQYSSMSPMYDDNNFDPSQAREADEVREFLRQINPTQATWAPIRKTKSLPIDDSTSPPSPPPVITDNHSTGHDSDNFT